MTLPSDDLDAALDGLARVERAALAAHFTAARDRWAPRNPRMAAVWGALAARVTAAQQRERARLDEAAAADEHADQPQGDPR